MLREPRPRLGRPSPATFCVPRATQEPQRRRRPPRKPGPQPIPGRALALAAGLESATEPAPRRVTGPAATHSAEPARAPAAKLLPTRLLRSSPLGSPLRDRRIPKADRRRLGAGDGIDSGRIGGREIGGRDIAGRGTAG